MQKNTFKAFVVREQDDTFTRSIETLNTSDLPDNGLLIKVHYSSLNYKDALSATGNKGITRTYPHTPGIDAAGTVVHSNSAEFAENDKVIVTGNDLGMNTPGGFGEYINVPPHWAVKLPDELNMKEAMILGTAGFTAGLCILRLTEKIKPDHGTIVVSGATGGVGSTSVAILSKLGYDVAAISGKTGEKDFLEQLGAKEIIPRDKFNDAIQHPMLKGTYAGAIDTVGGNILENIIKSTKPLGIVTCCGNVASAELHLTVLPFILRGISLVGVSSQNCPLDIRKLTWQKLASEWKPEGLDRLANDITLANLDEKIKLILKGKLKGRTVVKIG